MEVDWLPACVKTAFLVIVGEGGKRGTLPPTNMAPVGRYLKDEFPFEGTPVSCHVSGKEGRSGRPDKPKQGCGK